MRKNLLIYLRLRELGKHARDNHHYYLARPASAYEWYVA
jgi:hypothetical protein